MTKRSVLTVSVCPHCCAKNLGHGTVCADCGQDMDPDESESRLTMPTGEGQAPDERSLPEDDLQHEDPPESVPTGPDPLIGFVVAGRYRILECIGRGGMGVVYKVEHTEIGKLLALKLLAGELCRQREVVQRFKREALLASRLSHPNCVQVFDFGVCEGLTYIVMELVVGWDLARIIRVGGPVQPARLLKIMIQVCSSVAEAHNLGIIHRDLKPENILVARARDGSDLAKVLDFGLAKLREAPDLNEVTGTGSVVGTPYYMAPEQICGRPVDGRTDIYALGAVMYKALTGEMAFQGPNPMAVFTKHLTEMPVPPTERCPGADIPRPLSDLVMCALSKEPSDRFQRVEDLQVALIGQLDGVSQSSIETLLNSDQLRALQADVLRAASREADPNTRSGKARLVALGEIATRNEVDAFKRKLERQKWVGRAVALGAFVVCACLGIRAYLNATAPSAFDGMEHEPNNQANQAGDLPFGLSIQGILGHRISPEQGDRDYFRTTVPQSAHTISIDLHALPNIPACLWAYRSGESSPIAKFCTGRPGLDLAVPAYRLDPGAYLFAVMQDRDATGVGSSQFVHENVSDFYRLSVGPSTETSSEIEPNDSTAVASQVASGSEIRGRFGWTDDVDVVCLQPSGGPCRAQWLVQDAIERPRDRGAVLQVIQSSDSRPTVPIHVHRAGLRDKPTGNDLLSPWKSDPFDCSQDGKSQCLSLKLSLDPWAGPDGPLTPPLGSEQWVVRVEPVP